ncbi:uncharacterized protein M421DRAFT_224836 [Didymella exigua CBS 183.55]|uniref:Uncharacterized protein n=1 Tax=Didymella exigua CBS 183.55 TaxID=1150837 RepID=A0A6A5RFN2_9PLEO|nr:uncharacterized protein M421DRAFT_224836 [Didymella exigua CBS 183.55]KAF1926100.1 hypothetical protein M421DRAFT_224836 [Didymella exigua CBS 183.55]
MMYQTLSSILVVVFTIAVVVLHIFRGCLHESRSLLLLLKLFPKHVACFLLALLQLTANVNLAEELDVGSLGIFIVVNRLVYDLLLDLFESFRGVLLGRFQFLDHCRDWVWTNENPKARSIEHLKNFKTCFIKASLCLRTPGDR